MRGGARIGAAAVVLGFFLLGSQAMGVAAADSPDDQSSVSSHSVGTGHRSGTAHSKSDSGPLVGGHARRSASSNRSAHPGVAAPSRIRATKGAAPEPAPAKPAASPEAESEGPLVTEAAKSVPSSAVLSPLRSVDKCMPVKVCQPCRVSVPPLNLLSQNRLTRADNLLSYLMNGLSKLPANPVTDFVSGVLLLLRRTSFQSATIMFPEIDSRRSTLALRVNPAQQQADAIKVEAGQSFTLTLPGPASSYTVIANKPELVTIALSAGGIGDGSR